MNLGTGKISSYKMRAMPRRKPGTLLPLEEDILRAALAAHDSGEAVFHGFGLARDMRERSGSRALTAHGTLYKALGRLEDAGLLASTWEDAAAAEGRPRRRLYRLTAEGEQAARGATVPSAAPRSARARVVRPA